MYGYILQDPVNLIDPSGMSWALPAVFALGSVIYYFAPDIKYNYEYYSDPKFRLREDIKEVNKGSKKCDPNGPSIKSGSPGSSKGRGKA